MKKADLRTAGQRVNYSITTQLSSSHATINYMSSAKRLHASFAPEHYELTLKIAEGSKSFSGSAVITGQLKKPAQRITLHQRDLTITGATITRHERKREHSPEVTRIHHHKKLEEVRLHTEDKLYPGNYTVTVEFKGSITDVMNGIYPSRFDHDGVEEVILATQFESHHAREAFPCIDEPAAKATFSLSIETPAIEGQVVLSNTPELSRESSDGLSRISFEKTPRMSTYLLAFVIGKMHCFEAKTKDGIVVRSWSAVARPVEQLTYATHEAVKLLEFYTEYFGVPFPLSKCDQVALPDFDAGAMENWGLITYREVALLADPQNRSISSEQYVSIVVAHELSHQWFGNLVTMQWWDDLWLNESFASIMEHLSLDVIHPEWKQWEHYTALDIISSSNRDIYKDIQPVGVKVTDPELIETLFDPGIVYAKGGRLLKMLRDYIGDKDFSKALQIYFHRHEYGNTTREDLWRAMSEVSGKDIGALMTPWITQPGLALVRVSQDAEKVHLSQERFVLDAQNDTTLWPIPLLANETLKPDLLKTKEATIVSESKNPILLNHQGSAHFVTQYIGDNHTQHLITQLQNQKISAEARINMLNDLLLLARRGDDSLTKALQIIEHTASEPRDNVWGLITRVIGSASVITEGDEESEAALRTLRKQLSQQWYTTLGWDDQKDDDPNTKQLRHTALSLMVGSEDESALNEAKARFKKADSIESLPAEIRGTILSVMVRHDDDSYAMDLLEQYPSAHPEVQSDITGALSSTKDPMLAKRILEKALGINGFVRPQDLLRWIALFMRNYRLREITWEYMTENWEWIQDTLGKSKSFDYLPTYCAGAMNDEAWQKRYHEFFEPLESHKMLHRNILVGYSDIAARVAWRNRDHEAVKKWLVRYSATEH